VKFVDIFLSEIHDPLFIPLQILLLLTVVRNTITAATASVANVKTNTFSQTLYVPATFSVLQYKIEEGSEDAASVLYVYV
jgi:hypothetical protein